MRKISRMIFSRYAVCAAAILFDVALITLLVLRYISLYFWFAVVATAVAALVVISLINREINPEFKVTWLVIVFLLPVFGAILYLLFYSRRMSGKDIKKMKRVDAALLEYREREEELCAIGSQAHSFMCLSELSSRDGSAGGRALSLLRDDKGARLFSGSSSKYFSDGRELFSDMLSALRQARSYIFLEYFIIEDGVMWQQIYRILKEKVEEGVDVRLLYDDIGCMNTLPHHFDRKMRKEGIKCYRFGAVTPTVSSVHNNRDHRKILVIDGKVAYTGGVNIADEYINEKQRFGHWKDGGIRVTGDAVLGFTSLFLSLYDFTSGEISDYDSLLLKARSEAEGGTDGGYYIPFGSGPAPLYERPSGKCAYMNIINRAEKYLYITTPYLVVDYDLIEALRQAALRGVDVRIITPAIADKKIVKIITKSFYPRLISAGVRIFEYTPGFIHEKLLLSDDVSGVVGTINMDYRSLVHHFEDALWIYGSPELIKIRDSFMDTVSVSREIDEKSAGLKLHEKIVRYFVRVFAPLL